MRAYLVLVSTLLLSSLVPGAVQAGETCVDAISCGGLRRPGINISATPLVISSGQSTFVSFNALYAQDTASTPPDVTKNCTTNFSYTTYNPNNLSSFYDKAGGSTTAYPSVTTTYTATCRLWDSEDVSGPHYSTETASVVVTVNPALLPDLTAGSITPTTATLGTATTLSATVSNTGTAATGGGFTTLFQRATDASGTGATDIGTHSRTTALPGSQSFSASLSYTFPSAGTWYVRACADKSSATDSGAITEGNEGNNCGAWTQVQVQYQCSDGVDNNGGGGVDYPSDASCTDGNDNTEDGVVTGVSCSASPSTINVPGLVTYTASGPAGTYTWTPSAPSTSCTPNPGSPTVCTIAVPGTHVMSVMRSGGGSATCAPNVTAGCAGPVAVSLSANGAADDVRVKAGSNVTLAWQVSGVNAPTTCSLTDIGDVTPAACSATGSQSVGPVTTQKIYTLTCGSVSDSVIVNVTSGQIEF